MIAAALPSAPSFLAHLIVPALVVIALLFAIHLLGAFAYARRTAREVRSELRAGRDRSARGIVLRMEGGGFGETAYRFLPKDLRDRFPKPNLVPACDQDRKRG